MTHSSLSESNNERLEFLGDAVLDLIVSDWLFKHFGELREGRLTEYKSMLVSRSTLSKIGSKLNLQNHLEVGPSFKGKAIPKSLIGNAFEAIIGAIFLDLSRQESLVLLGGKVREWLEEDFSKLATEYSHTNAKQLLQKFCQKKLNALPRYQTTEEESGIFKSTLFIQEKNKGEGLGKTKKAAERLAAQEALKSFPIVEEHDE